MNDINDYTENQIAIRNAIIQVEELGAHPLLTDAVVALSKYLHKVQEDEQ